MKVYISCRSDSEHFLKNTATEEITSVSQNKNLKVQFQSLCMGTLLSFDKDQGLVILTK